MIIYPILPVYSTRKASTDAPKSSSMASRRFARVASSTNSYTGWSASTHCGSKEKRTPGAGAFAFWSGLFYLISKSLNNSFQSVAFYIIKDCFTHNVRMSLVFYYEESPSTAQCMTDDENPMCTVRPLKLYWLILPSLGSDLCQCQALILLLCVCVGLQQ